MFPAVKPKERLGFPNIGARGCFLSHYQILSDALRRGLANALIVYMLKFSKSVVRLRRPRLSYTNRAGVVSRSLSSSELYMVALAVSDTVFLLSYLVLIILPSMFLGSELLKE